MNLSLRRFTVAVLAAAAAVALTGCTSEPDSAAPGTVSSTGATSSAPSADAPSSAATSTERTMQESFTSSSLSSRAPAPSPTAPKPSGSGAVGSFDATTTQWFSALCTGLVAANSTTEFDGSGSFEEQRSKAAEAFTSAGSALSQADAQLQQFGSPALPTGDQLQATLGKALPAMSKAATEAVGPIEQAADADALRRAIGQGNAAVDTAKEPLLAFDEAVGAPAVAAQLSAIPACTPLF